MSWEIPAGSMHRKSAGEVRQTVREGVLQDGLSALAIMMADEYIG